MLGVGAGAYALAIAPFSKAIVSHNVPLGILVERGSSACPSSSRFSLPAP